MNTADTSLQKPLPNSAESERAILGAIILDNSLISQAIEQIKADDFFVPAYRRIYLAMMRLFEKGSEINALLIGEELKKDDGVESVGGFTALSNLTYGLPHFSNLDAFSKVIIDKSTSRKLVKVCNKIITKVLDEEEDAPQLLDYAESEIFQLTEEQPRSSFVSLSYLVENRLEQIQDIKHTDGITGIPTGIMDLDLMTSGLQPTDLIIVAARPSQGKSALAFNIASNAAADKQRVIAFFSLEMNKEMQVADRMICQEARVDLHRFRTGKIYPAEWSKLAQANELFSARKIEVDDTPGISVMQLRAKARRIAAKHKRLDLIIVDYLQLMSASRRAESRQQEVSQISRELKALAKEFGVPVIALSQLSRAPETRSDHRPILSDLRESGAIEMDADVVAFIFREEVYHQSDSNRGIAEIIIAKQRNGPTGTVKVAFLKEFSKFESLWSG